MTAAERQQRRRTKVAKQNLRKKITTAQKQEPAQRPRLAEGISRRRAKSPSGSRSGF